MTYLLAIGIFCVGVIAGALIVSLLACRAYNKGYGDGYLEGEVSAGGGKCPKGNRICQHT